MAGDPKHVAGDRRTAAARGRAGLDLATVIAGPYAASILGEFGADVIKVEQPKEGCSLRKFGTPTAVGDTLTWLSDARNKRSWPSTCAPRRAGMLKRLVASQRRARRELPPRAPWSAGGSGGRSCSEINPRLVMLRVTGYGQTGPYSRPARLRARGARRRRPRLPRGDAQGRARHPRVDDARRLHDRALRLHRDPHGAPPSRRDRRGPVHRRGLYESVFRCTAELAPAYGMYGVVRERRRPPQQRLRLPQRALPHRATEVGRDQLRDRQALRAPRRGDGRPELAADHVYGGRRALL
jgi:succinyl-CoA:(S)-malate CoA-transferase subunit B